MQLPEIGHIAAFAGNFVPTGWEKCDGRLLYIVDFEELFILIGTRYGGDGQTHFAVPTLSDPIPGVSYVIATSGIFSTEKRPPWPPSLMGFAAEWNGDPPPGTIRPIGQVLRISEASALFSLLGDAFGGNGRQGTFAVPNLGPNWVFCNEGPVPQRPRQGHHHG